MDSGIAMEQRGYQCEFVIQPSDEMLCKSCRNVAKELTMTLCCYQHYCHECIAPFKADSQPCPGCGEGAFEILPHGRYRKMILGLHVYCTMKKCGCDWIGALKDLAEHINPENNNCQYINVECPNKCSMPVQRWDVASHLETYCSKRQYSCEYCFINGTYEFIITQHIWECEQVEITCPNECMVGTIKRSMLQEHLKTCPYEQIYCKIPGCNGKFTRADERGHEEKNTLKHIALLSSAVHPTEDCVSRSEFQQAIDEKMLEAIEKAERENTLLKQELLQSQAKIEDLRKEIVKITEKFQKHLQVFSQQAKLLAGDTPYFFTVSDFKERRLTNSTWYSPPMYIQNGPKFTIALLPNGPSIAATITNQQQKYVSLALWGMPGESDDRVKWPVACTIIVELRNQLGDLKHYRVACGFHMECPLTGRKQIGYFVKPPNKLEFISHAGLDFNTRNQTQYLKNDCLHLLVSIETHSDVYRRRNATIH